MRLHSILSAFNKPYYYKYAQRQIPCACPLCKCPSRNTMNYSFVYICEKRDIIYYDVPKCASSTIREELFHNDHGFSLRNPRKGLDKYYKFTFVRNPWDRMVSLYGLFRRPTEQRHQLRRPSKKTPYKLDKIMDALTHKRANQAMSKNAKRQLADMAFGLGFKEWLAFCDEYRWNGCPYLDTDLPMTRIPQVEWFEGLDRVFKFEDRDALDECLDDMGYPVAVPENQTVHEPWESYYDANTYDLVAKAFAEDIARFGY